MAGGGNISVVIGDFLASGSNIAHCISADIKMSKGVALEIRSKVWGGGSTESPKSKGWKRWCHELWTRLGRKPYIYIPSGT